MTVSLFSSPLTLETEASFNYVVLQSTRLCLVHLSSTAHNKYAHKHSALQQLWNTVELLMAEVFICGSPRQANSMQLFSLATICQTLNGSLRTDGFHYGVKSGYRPKLSIWVTQCKGLKSSWGNFVFVKLYLIRWSKECFVRLSVWLHVHCIS